MRYLILFLMFLSLSSLQACNRNESSPRKSISAAEVGKPAPDILITPLDGAPFKLSTLKGKVVMLNFWATWCPPCRQEIPSMIMLNKAMEGKPFQMLPLSIDEGGKPAVTEFLKQNDYSLAPYFDPENSAAKQYGITGVPETFIIGKDGVLVKKIIGPLTWDSPDVISFLEELMK